MGQKHQTRRRLVVVELRQERRQHLLAADGLVGLREIRPVAPVLPIAEEEHLDAELPCLLVDRKDIRLLHRLRVHALHALDRRQGREPVAAAGRALEFERMGGLLHFLGDARLHGVRFARQEPARLFGEVRVFVEGNFLRAGARTALDLEQQAGPRAVFVIAVVARAQQKRPLQRVDGAVHRPHARERAVIIPFALARAAMLDELRRLVIAGEQDVGKRLVVPQQHVVARAQLLDEVGLEQQRLGFGRGGDELHRRGFGDHPGDPVRMPLPARIGADAGLQAARLADIQHVALAIEHAIDARRIGQGPPEMLDDLGAALHRSGMRLEVELDIGPALEGNDVLVFVLAQDLGRNVVGGLGTHGRDLGACDSAGKTPARTSLCIALGLKPREQPR